MRKLIIIFPLAAALSIIVGRPAVKGDEIIVHKVEVVYDVTFAQTPTGSEKLDIAWPSDGGPYPVIVYFHGGAFTVGDKSMFRQRMRILARSGYVVFNANYRFSQEARWPAQVNDAFGAIIFAKHKAPVYNGDPERVAAMGDSAGAYLSAMAAVAWDDPYFNPSYQDGGNTPRVRAAVLMYGAYRFREIVDEDPRLWGVIFTRPLALALMGGTPEMRPEQYRRASVETYLDRPDVPPMFILCGTADAVYPQSQWLHQALEKRGVEHTAYFVKDAEHEFNVLDVPIDFPYLRAILDFLDKEMDNHTIGDAGQ